MPSASLVYATSGLSFFERYPYGSTEQQVARARAYVAYDTLLGATGRETLQPRTERAVTDALATVGRSIDGYGLVADWPGTDGSVPLKSRHPWRTIRPSVTWGTATTDSGSGWPRPH